MAWSTSDRRSRLPADWPVRRDATRERAGGRCEADVHEPECDGIGTECDHRERGDDHSLSNLQWLSPPCHRAKTQREAAAALRASRAAARRQPERHPLDDAPPSSTTLAGHPSPRGSAP